MEDPHAQTISKVHAPSSSHSWTLSRKGINYQERNLLFFLGQRFLKSCLWPHWESWSLSSQPFAGNYFCVSPWSSPELSIRRAPTLFRADKAFASSFLDEEMCSALCQAYPTHVITKLFACGFTYLTLYNTLCQLSFLGMSTQLFWPGVEVWHVSWHPDSHDRLQKKVFGLFQRLQESSHPAIGEHKPSSGFEGVGIRQV